MAVTDVPTTPDNSQPPPDPTLLDSSGPSVPDTGQPTAPDPSQTSAVNTLAGSTPATPSQMMNQAAAVHHSRLADSINAVSKFLGGDTSYHITTNPDGSVNATPTESTPGQRWGRIAQAALMGAAKGFAVGQGPGGAQRAAAAGVETGMALPQAQQDQTMALAQKMNDQNQQRQLYNANIAYLNTRNLEQSWQLDQNKKLAVEHDEAGDLQFNALQKQLHMIDVGPAANVEQAATIYNGNPQVQQALVGKGGQLVIHHSSSGPPHAYIIPEDKLTELNPNDQIGHDWSVDPDTLKVVQGQHTISGNTESGLTTAARIAKEQSDKLAAIKTAADAQLKRAQGQEAENKANAPAAPVGTYSYREDANGNPIAINDKTLQVVNLPKGIQAIGSKEKRDAAVEKVVKPIRDALNYANNYVGLGQFTGPGDEALQEKFFNLARPDSGFRMSTPVIQQLQNSRSMIQGVIAKGQRLRDGTWFSPEQRKQIVDTMNVLAQSSLADPNELRTPGTAGTGGGTGGGNIQIPEPIAPARPGGRIPSVINGQSGSFDANGLWTSDDGTVTRKLPGRNTGTGGVAPLPMPKVGDVVAGRTYLGGNPAQQSSWR